MSNFIEEQIALYPDLAPAYVEMNGFFHKKLWHELTITVETFISNPSHSRENNFMNLYTHFISKFEARISQLRFALLLTKIGYSLKDPSKALELFENTLQNRARLGEDASLCLEMDIVSVKLQLGLVKEGSVGLRTGAAMLQTLPSSTSSAVHSKYHKAATEYRKLAGPPKEFYKAALCYMGYTSVESISKEEQYTLATDMILAAIVAEDVFNFGEVIATPVLSAVLGTANEWLFLILHALNDGDIDKFNGLVDTHKDAYYGHEAIARCHENIKQKAVLLSVMNMVFERTSHDRCVPFQDIADRARMPVDQVEWILMKAFSLGLLQGLIDEAGQVVNVSWIQPRILDKAQLSMLNVQLGDWQDKVKTTLVTVEDHMVELMN